MLGVDGVQRNDFTANFTCTVLKKDKDSAYLPLNLPPDRGERGAFL